MKSLKGIRVAAVCLGALMLLAGSVNAGTRITAEGADLTPVMDPAEGWVSKAEGLWERPAANGNGVETYASGVEGLRAALVSLKTRLAELVDAYLAQPSEKRREMLEQHMSVVREVEADLAAREKALRAGEEGGIEAAPWAATASPPAAAICQRNFSYGASSTSFHCLQNSPANASYSTNNPTLCPELCTVHSYSYGYSACSEPTEESQSCTQTGTNVSCFTNAIIAGYGPSCYLYAFASIHCPQLGGLYLYQSANVTTCRCPSGGC